MPYIKRETIDKVYEAADLVQVIRDYVELKKSGSTYKGLSPFVKEKTASFMVSPAKGIWKDFSSGHGGNSAIDFLMKKDGLTYPEAIEILAKKYSIPLEYEDSKRAKAYAEKQKKKEALRPVLESTIRKYEEAFAALPATHPAKKEVYEHRGYTDAIVEEYRIGFAPGGRFIFELAQEAGRFDDAKKIGLISDNGDKWVNRVIYPLIRSKGQSRFAVGLAGRRLDDNEKYAKWLNSADSALYSKDHFWYGLDKAKAEIVKRGEVWLVEGYNDVIAWQTHGIANTVAGCGTAITKSQMKMLRKLCDKVILCLDPDKAGKKAMLRYIPGLIKQGFRVQMVQLPDGMDPDDYARENAHLDDGKHIAETINDPAYRTDGFKFLMDARFANKDEIGTAQEAKELVALVFDLVDEAMSSIYLDWLAKESGVKKSTINAWVKSLKEEQEEILQKIKEESENEFYILPKEVDIPLEDLKDTIQRYQLFMANNQIWVQSGDQPPYHFRSVSNFQIEILQHLQDEKFPKKLIRVRNVYKQEKVFDIQSAEMNTPQTFENAVTNYGNYRWKGNRKDHELLKTYLMDKMGNGRMIEVLGWQTEGFAVTNDLVISPDGKDIEIDENGVFEKDKVSYYVPSANQAYENNRYKYDSQKRVLLYQAPVNFQSFCGQMIKVHREHAIMGLLFSVASLFQDIVVDEIGSFPMLFLFGPASSGKDQLAAACQSFWGKPQTAINLEGGVSTSKAQIREFAQFCNLIAHLSEYKYGDPKLDGILKGLWDRRGYKRGTLDSHVSSESIPILSSVIMTGNYAPDQEALVTRLIWCFMDKTVFDDEENKDYEKLQDIIRKGISSYTRDFLRYRERVEKEFKKKYRQYKENLGARHKDANSRMISNLSVLGAFYQLFHNDFEFTFSHQEMDGHFDHTIEKQMNKLDSASIINRWWDCFLAGMRGNPNDIIQVGRDFNVSGNQFYFNFTNCYNRIQRQWFIQYRDNAPSKGVMQDALRKDKAWIEYKNVHRFGSTRSARSSSAYVVRAKDIPLYDEIMMALDFQNGMLGAIANAQQNNENTDDSEDGQEDLPF